MRPDITKLLDSAIAFAKDELRCDEVVISYSVGEQKRLVVENKEFSLANSLDRTSIGVMVHKQKKMGSASINTLIEDDLKTALKAAADITQFSVADEALTIAEKAEAPRAKDLGFMYDENLLRLDLNALQKSMLKALQLVIGEHRLALERFELSLDGSEHGLVNSHGVKQSELTTSVSWDYLGMAKDGDEVSGMDYDSNFSYSLKGFEPQLLRDMEIFKDRVLQNLNPLNCPTYKGKVIISPRAVDDLLLSTILYHAGGSQVMDGKSKWGSALGKKVASELLSIRDLPHDARFMGATSFDSDGLPTQSQQIMEKGKLKLHVFDCYSARRCSTKSNGMAGGPFALEIEPGKTALKDLLAMEKQILYVDRFSGNVDPLTGDFSGVAKCSSLYKNGKRQGAVKETMIAANVFEMLNNIVALSQEQDLVSAQYLSPSVMVDGVSVSSG